MHINQLAAAIRDQADTMFPRRTDSSMFLKMYGEMGELIDAKTDQERAGELADVLIMLLDYADIHNIDVLSAVLGKMAINSQRKWAVNELGVFSHVK